MSHLTELQFSMLADNEISGDELQLVQQHCAEAHRH